MSTSKGEGKSIPEWSIFERLDELETITLNLMDKTEFAEPTLQNIGVTLKDANVMAKYALLLAFGHLAAVGNPEYAEHLRDSFLQHLKSMGLSPASIEWSKEMMTYYCTYMKQRSNE